MKPLLLALAMIVCGPTAHGQTQMEMNAQAASIQAEADAGLNKVYQSIVRDLKQDPEALEKFRQKQRDWLSNVDKKIQAEFPVGKGEDPRVLYGSMYSLEVSSLRTDLILNRIAELQKIGGRKDFDLAAFQRKHEIAAEEEPEKPAPKAPSKNKTFGL